ncbi:hypothetical protein CHU32_06075 [Superficieibacter electus]|uniref:DUF2509 domain-containing protein n=1 Tax=Superficieibacter electus TaxID=2022662 RepID=A0A2P5GTB8_9ENTR|nr:DUF2509 family protein [Superficieibacter electus]POP46321.1 hypothetical protein CHU33_06060 [Superficieibacter electus]POP49791.1 hypothetical protein CHU32_06075 [Superficieibacter electus]
MNRQRGMSSLALVLLLLVLGSLMLQGLNQQQRALSTRVAVETLALREQASVHSALQWGKMQHWQGELPLQCLQQSAQHWQVCLRRLSDDSLLLIAVSGSMSLWQSGEIRAGEVHFSPHGWSDFCPLTESALCHVP